MDTESAHDRGRSLASITPAAPEDILSRMRGHGARPLVSAVEAMIRDGSLRAGQRLPSIRAIAVAGAMSPTTVSEAWRVLHAEGLLHTEGRRGSHVSFLARVAPTGRWRLTSADPLALDLSSGSPDPDLLPEVQLRPDELAGLFRRSSYYGAVVEPELERAICAEWGASFVPEKLTVVDGSMDAVSRLAALLLAPGDVVVMEEPSFPPLWQLMHTMRCVVRAIEIDSEGPRPSRLRLAAAARPRLFVYQPRAQNPTGAALTESRLDALAHELESMPETLVIELDSAGSVSSAPLLTLASRFPERVIRVQGFSKSHSPDLRLAAVGGPGSIIDAVEERRLLGPGWSSRALQSVLAHLLESPDAQNRVAEARRIYAERSRALVTALRSHGIPTDDADGFNLWIPATDAIGAAVDLTGHGVGVAIGAPFQVNPTARDHLRITVATLPLAQAERVGELVANAIRRPGSRLIAR